MPDAQAAYTRMTTLQAQPGDIPLIIEAAHQGGMPVEIVNFGLGVENCLNACETCRNDPSQPHVHNWQAAYEQLIAQMPSPS